MPDYRVYDHDANGEAVTPPEVFFATSDEAAINFAAGRTAPHGCELWCRDRFVAALAPETPTDEPGRPRGLLRQLLDIARPEPKSAV